MGQVAHLFSRHAVAAGGSNWPEAAGGPSRPGDLDRVQLLTTGAESNDGQRSAWAKLGWTGGHEVVRPSAAELARHDRGPNGRRPPTARDGAATDRRHQGSFAISPHTEFPIVRRFSKPDGSNDWQRELDDAFELYRPAVDRQALAAFIAEPSILSSGGVARTAGRLSRGPQGEVRRARHAC